MPRVTQVLRQCSKAVEDLRLIQALQHEIQHELSTTPPFLQNAQSGYLGDFVMDWDSPQTRDVVLRKKSESGEEVAISAMLDEETDATEGTFPREVLMKVCVTKPGLSSMLQFDCRVFEKDISGSQFDIYNAYYHQSLSCSKPSAYLGPEFRTLDPHLQDALKKFLMATGISESLTNFLILHLHRKEQDQYVSWLKKLKSMLAQGD